MEAFFLLPVASSSADSLSSSLFESGDSVLVGDTDGDGGAGWVGADNGLFFLALIWAGSLAGYWSWDRCWEPVVSSSVAEAVVAAAAATAAVRGSRGGLMAIGLGSPICQLDGAVIWNYRGLAFIIMALSMSSSGSLLSEDGS